MRFVRLRELGLLFVGDLFFLYISLWVTLLVRYIAVPSDTLWEAHLAPFSLLFAVWLLMYFIVGLYDQHTTILHAKLPERILRVQIGNVIIAALFFFFVPIFGIAPKTNLVLYLIISSTLMVFWRVAIVPRLLKRKSAPALLIAGGVEYKDLHEEISKNTRYPFYIADTLRIDHADGGSLSDQIFAKLKNPDLAYVIVDIHHRKLEQILPHLYKPIFSNVKFIDARELYENIFERVPLSVLNDPQFIEILTAKTTSPWYEASKRLIDIAGALVMGVCTVIVAPLLWLLMRFEGPGSLVIAQDRMGQGGRRIHSYKFRSMSLHDKASAEWVKEGKNKVTRVGSVLRRISLDEFPQFINVLRGDISLIGPRNDIEGLAKRLAEAIPYYEFRYIVKSGLTGWAQINQQYEPGNISPQSIEETKMRLAYDFYYIKNRSFMLDVMIALKTLKRMLFRMSSW
jgi:lipopolysaccharide/colanic/teichoic acid biosynthesis glycosyltransferase